MRGAFLLSHDPDLFREVSDVLWELGGEVSRDDGVAQMRDTGGHLFTIEGPVPEEFQRGYREGPHLLGSGTVLPDFDTLSACVIECRWVDFFLDVVAQLVPRLRSTCWILDAGDVVWQATDIDRGRLRL